MTDARPPIEDIEQHEIAMEVMYKATANSLTKAGSLDRGKAAAFLRAAAVERHQGGDHRAAQLLGEWAEKMGKTVGMGKEESAKKSSQSGPAIGNC